MKLFRSLSAFVGIVYDFQLLHSSPLLTEGLVIGPMVEPVSLVEPRVVSSTEQFAEPDLVATVVGIAVEVVLRTSWVVVVEVFEFVEIFEDVASHVVNSEQPEAALDTADDSDQVRCTLQKDHSIETLNYSFLFLGSLCSLRARLISWEPLD